jgi:hypothetical protein
MRLVSSRYGNAIILMATTVLLTSGSIGCSTEQTAPGEAPDVDVDVDPGRWPEYKVNWADVDVGTRERTVTVPVVQVTQETRQVQVPYIDINPPGARDREERTIQVEVDAPHAGYQRQITEVRAAGDDLWVVAQLREGDAPAAQAVTRVSDQVVVNAPANLDVCKVIIGTRPPGGYNEQHRFVDSMEALTRAIPQGSRVLYQRSQS